MSRLSAGVRSLVSSPPWYIRLLGILFLCAGGLIYYLEHSKPGHQETTLNLIGHAIFLAVGLSMAYPEGLRLIAGFAKRVVPMLKDKNRTSLLILPLLLFVRSGAAQEQPAPRFTAEELASHVVVLWRNRSAEPLMCVYGHRDSATVYFDSVTAHASSAGAWEKVIGQVCRGHGAVGFMRLVDPPPADLRRVWEQVMAHLLAILAEARPDFVVVGVVHDTAVVTRLDSTSGTWGPVTVPRVYWIVRVPAAVHGPASSES